MKRIKYLAVIIAIIGFSTSQVKSEEIKEPEVVNSVDINKYSGKWYEIASYPIYFQEGCMCTTAEYTPIDDYIRVSNQCQQNIINDKKDYIKERRNIVIQGKAFPVEGSNNSKLKVSFFEPFKGDYWIIDRDEEYSYAVVSNPQKSTLWVLSRTPRMKFSLYKAITNRLSDKGYDLSKLRKTLQHCKN